MAIEIVDFPIKNGDFPLQNVSSPEGNINTIGNNAGTSWHPPTNHFLMTSLSHDVTIVYPTCHHREGAGMNPETAATSRICES